MFRSSSGTVEVVFKKSLDAAEVAFGIVRILKGAAEVAFGSSRDMANILFMLLSGTAKLCSHNSCVWGCKWCSPSRV